MKNFRWTPSYIKALFLGIVTVLCMLLLLDRFNLSRGAHAALTGTIVFAVLLVFMARPFRKHLSASSATSGASENVED